MPYIKQKDRVKFEEVLNSLHFTRIETAGDLNYLITSIVQTFIANHKDGISYQAFNDAMGALEGVKQELYRRGIAPYEDLKIEENGDVENGGRDGDISMPNGPYGDED